MTIRSTLLIFTILFFGSKTFAQKFLLKGKVSDTATYSTTMYTSVSLVNASDSILVSFTRADEDGNFSLSADSAGKYIIIVAHPLFATYADGISLDQPTTDMGSIYLISKTQLIQEVIVSDRKAITIKGDTTEYAADSFKVREFDNVDELLKKLPGLEVDKDGNIKAYGEKVQKMLVDGDEFFADDPAVVAKMLRASSVDKVQVFDKKSEQAEFTGIDDGEKTKTINLQLKESARKGYFGRIAAGAGLPRYWENQAMINAFQGKRKIAAYGIMSNTNNNGLAWGDSQDYGGDGNMEIGDDGSVYISRTSDGDESSGFDGTFNGRGLPKTWTAGTHYGNKWLEDKIKLNGSYQFNKNIHEAFDNTRTQYVLPDTQYINTTQSNSIKQYVGHKVNATLDYNIDSLTSIRVNVGGRLGETRFNTENNIYSTNLDGDYINNSEQSRNLAGDKQSFNGNVLIKRKFYKKGRTLSLNLSGNIDENSSTGFYRSYNEYFSLGSSDSVNQRKEIANAGQRYSSKLSYTEPLAKNVFLELNYSLNINNQENKTLSYDRSAELATDTLNSLFSSNYVYNILTNSGGANVRFNYTKVNFSLGGNVANANFHQGNRFDNSSVDYAYLNFFPRANFQYRKSQQSSVSLNYNGQTRQPSITELQPILQNTDPLNVMIGNPDLKQEFRHNMSLSYNDYKVLSSRSIWMSANFSFTQNAISQSQNVDEAGRRTYQSINVNGNKSGGFYMNYGRRFQSLNMSLNGGLSGNFSSSNNMVNGLQNVSNNYNLGPNLGLYYWLDTTLSLSVSSGAQYNNNKSSLRSDIVTDFWSWNESFQGRLQLPFKIELSVSVDWQLRQKIDAQDANNNVFRLDAYVSKSFLKNRSLVLKAAGYDILNQNIGFTRYTYDNYITESRYNNIRRYFMLSLTWNFTKSGATSSGDTGAE